MRIHSDILTQHDLTIASNLAGTWHIRRTNHNSRKRAAAFDVALSGSSPSRAQADREQYAASWDEWGMYLAALYRRDPKMVTPYYADADDFHFQTHNRFREFDRSEHHNRHNWEHAGIYRRQGGDVTFFICKGSRSHQECDAEMHRVLFRRG